MDINWSDPMEVLIFIQANYEDRFHEYICGIS